MPARERKIPRAQSKSRKVRRLRARLQRTATPAPGIRIKEDRASRIEPVRVERTLQGQVEAHVLGEPQADGIPSLTYPGPPSVRLPIPVRIWISTNHNSKDVQHAVVDLMAAYGFATSKVFPSELGSWYRPFIFKLRRAASSKDLRKRLDKLERGLELQFVSKAQAEVDSAQGDAVAKLLVALADTPDALIQIGSVLLIKINGVPTVRNLTQAEIALLEKDPTLLRDPVSAVAALQRASQESRMVPRGSIAGDVEDR